MRNRHDSASESERDAAHAREQETRNRQDASAEIKADCERDEARAKEQAATWVPCAYPQPGGRCGEPAIGYDHEHGWVLCREHLDAYLKREEQL